MKILWIEDFGGGQSSPMGLSQSIFKSILVDKEDDMPKIFANIKPKNIFTQLPEIFQNHTIHKIDICKNYKNWLDKYKNNFDFDIILIDINLEEGSSQQDIPAGFGNDFHKKAGFYIYHEILKKGFPDDNIAFFTGESGSYSEFEISCKKSAVPLPGNVYEKGKNDNQDIRKWVNNKSNSYYLILRRAVIDSCSEIMKIVNNFYDDDFESYVIFNKTILKNPLTKNDLIRFLTKLRFYFPIENPNRINKKNNYLSFVKELSDLWERSQGYLKRTDVKYSGLEFNFKNFCQNQMKLLRNWTAHNQLSDELTEKDLAFFFMIAIRALLNLDLNNIYRYEKKSLTLFNENKREFSSENIKKNLAKSYFNLRNVYARNDNPGRSEFNEVLRDIWKQKNFKKTNSIKYFYQNFWHGLFSTEFSVFNPAGKSEVEMKVKFEYQELEDKFLIELAKSIYKISFE